MEIKLSKNEIKLGQFGIEIEFIAPVGREDISEAIRNAGIECEAQGYNHLPSRMWKIVTDASVKARDIRFQGMEIVSPILVGKAGLEALAIVCDVLKNKGCKVNMTCGLHVHHDAPHFGPDKVAKMIRYYKKAEKVIDSMMPASRRGNANEYCRSMLDLDERQTPLSRYYKVNFQSLLRHTTVEFRHHSGTIEADKIQSWILLTALIMNKVSGCKKVQNDKPFEKWLDLKWDLGLSFQGEKTPEAEAMVKYYYKRIRLMAVEA
jgi:hypothetical protein